MGVAWSSLELVVGAGVEAGAESFVGVLGVEEIELFEVGLTHTRSDFYRLTRVNLSSLRPVKSDFPSSTQGQS